MSNGPTIQGSVEVSTSGIDTAIKSLTSKLDSLNTTLDKFTTTVETLSNTVNKIVSGLDKQTSAVTRTKKATDDAAKSTARQSDLEERNANRIDKATSKLLVFEQILKKKTLAGQEQNTVLSKGEQLLNNYANAVTSAAGDSGKLDSANTLLKVGFDDLNKSMNDMIKSNTNTTDATASQIKAMGSAEIQAMRLTDRVRGSALADDEKVKALARTNAALSQYNAVIGKSTSSTVQIAQAQKALKVEMESVSLKVKDANRSFRGQQIDDFNAKFRNLTSSVQVALGPLSGVASRMTALAGLFNRNATAVAALLASFTAYTVTLQKVLKNGKETELQLIQLDAIISTLGDTTTLTAERVQMMGTEIASATLTSANEARKAAAIVIQSASMTEDQIKQTVITAQGLSQVFGGDLASNARLLARAFARPSEAATQFRRKGIELDKSILDTVNALRRQGEFLKANQVLLDGISKFYDVAKDSAQTYAGALDAVSGNIDYLFEVLGSGGALEAATEQTNAFAESIRDFADSDDAQVLAKSFETFVKVLGSFANIALNNLNALLVIVVGMTASVLPVFIATMFKLTASVLTFAKGTNLGTIALFKIATGATVATSGMTKLAAATSIALGPIGALVFGIAGVVTAYGLLKGARNTVSEGIDFEISKLQRLIKTKEGVSKATRDEFAARVSGLEETKNLLQAGLEDEKKILRDRAQASRKAYQQFQGVTGSFAKLFGVYDKNAESSYNEAQKAYREQIRLVAELEKQLKAFSDEIAGVAEEFNNITAQQELLTGIGRAFDEVIDSVNPLEKQIAEATIQLEDFITNYEILKTEPGIDPSQLEYAKAVIRDLNERIQTMKDRLYGTSKEADNLAKKSEDAFKKLSDYIDDTNNKLAEHMDILHGTDTTNPLQKQLRKLSEQVNQLSSEDMDKLINKLAEQGIVVDTSSGKINGLNKALADLTQSEYDAAQAAEAFTQAQSRLDSHFSNSGSTLEQLNTKYQQLIQDAIDTNNVNLAPEISKQWAAELKKAELQMSTVSNIGPMGQMSDMEQLKLDFEMRRQALIDHYGEVEADASEHMAELKKNFEMGKLFLNIQKGLTTTQTVMGGVMDAMQAMGRENSKSYQQMAIGMAMIDGAMAILKVWNDQSLTSTWAKAAMVGVVSAKVGAQIAQIRSQSFSTGGYVSGKGTPTSDSIPAWLSNGEYVINAAAVRRLGLNNLNAMNDGKLPRLASGGGVGRLSPLTKSSEGVSPNVSVQIIDQSRGVDIDTTAETDENGRLQIRAIVKEQVKENLRRGEFDNDFSARFGLQRRGSMR